MISNKNKTILIAIMILIVAATYALCYRGKYVGYWCNYDEMGTIRITMKDKYTNKEKKAIEEVINNFQNMHSYDFILKEQFTTESVQVAYDTYIIYFNNLLTIDESKLSLENLGGISSVDQESVKKNVTLYEFKNRKDFLVQDGLAVNEELKVSGTYEIIDDKITLTRPTTTTELYIKDGYLCDDETCTNIFSKTDELCEKVEK